MGRLVRNWTPDLVADAVVAPHHYTWDRDVCDEVDYKAWKANVPYKAGDVVYLAIEGNPVKGRIINMICGRDRFGDRREVFTVQTETKTGLWSKLWVRTYPGFIQRGYLLAGLAPDCEGKL